MVSTKGDTRAQRLPKETCRFGTDLKFADLASVKSTKWLNDFVASVNGQLIVNTDRYMFQMAALETMLSKGALVSDLLNISRCSDVLSVLFILEPDANGTYEHAQCLICIDVMHLHQRSNCMQVSACNSIAP